MRQCGFVCEVFGYIPKTGESVTVVLEKENWEENDEGKHERQDPKEKNQIYRLEILAGNIRKVSAVRFERVNKMDEVSEAQDVKNMVPKFVRKWSSEEDSGGNHQAKNVVFDSLCKRIQDELTRFWWDKSTEARNMSWIAWNELPKSNKKVDWVLRTSMPLMSL